MRRALVLLAVASAWVTPRLAMAQAVARTNGPCIDCLWSRPTGNDPAPLLVVLHGDGETAGSVFDAWAPTASKRGALVFAPSCPRLDGCSAMSWWKWNGDPAWLRAQVDALEGQRAIDRSRMWIVGWSGGGTYLGWHTQDLEREYAAMVIHGGGVRPGLETCAPTPAGIYFLGGDANPLHGLAEQLHEYYATTCPHPDLVWTVLPGVDHQGERKALPRYREAILDWLSTHRRLTVDAAMASALPPSPTPTPSVPPPSPPPSASCRCAAAGAPSSFPWRGAIALVAALGLRLRARAPRRTRR